MLTQLQIESLHTYLFQSGDQSESQSPAFRAAGIPGRVRFPLLNPTNPQAGIHLVSKQMYGACMFQWAVYLKNTFDEEGLPRSVKVKLKLLASASRKIGYTAFSNRNETLGIELGEGEVIKLLQTLHGKKREYHHEVKMPGLPTKCLSISSQAQDDYPCVLLISQGQLNITTGLTIEQIWTISQLSQLVLRIQQPWNKDVLDQALMLTTGASIVGDRKQSSMNALPNDPYREVPMRVSPGQTKAIWAIYYNQPDHLKNRDWVNTMLTRLTFEQADIAIKAGNNGDYSHFQPPVGSTHNNL